MTRQRSGGVSGVVAWQRLAGRLPRAKPTRYVRAFGPQVA